jgi:hypothetical protein
MIHDHASLSDSLASCSDSLADVVSLISGGICDSNKVGLSFVLVMQLEVTVMVYSSPGPGLLPAASVTITVTVTVTVRGHGHCVPFSRSLSHWQCHAGSSARLRLALAPVKRPCSIGLGSGTQSSPASTVQCGRGRGGLTRIQQQRK